MKSIYTDYLFDKYIFVSNGETGTDQFETLFALANLFNIRIIEGEKLVSGDMIKYAASRLGQNVPEPFYRGFPQSVRELSPDKLLFDQLVHYTITYGFGNFSEAGHSLFEENFEKTAFKENADIREFRIITEEEAVYALAEIVNDLLAGTRPLSESQYDLVKEYIIDHGFMPENIASKNTAVKLLMDTRKPEFADFIMMSDVIKLVDEINYNLYQSENIKKLNLKNQDRKFITNVMNRLFEAGRVDIRSCFEKKKIWSGLLHHIHYTSGSDVAKQFVDAMRGKENRSVYSEFERAMAEKNITDAVDKLKAGKGSAAVLRNLNYLISRCENVQDMEYVINSIDSDNVIVLLQLLLSYSQYKQGNEPRTFKFTKYNMMKVHPETEEEQKKRKSVITVGQANMLAAKIKEKLVPTLRNRLGKVYIDPDMTSYALPLQETATQGGLGVLTKGSRLKLPETKKLRAFTYWEKADDIDLSVFGIDEDGFRREFSWRTMSGNQSEAITYSGDETSGYNGGSEYFDIDLDKVRELYPNMRYMIFCDNVFSGLNFDECFCKAGYMTRDLIDSGEVYEPKTVKSSFIINCGSRFAYLFGLDLKTNEFVWLNFAVNSRANVAGTTNMDFVLDYFGITNIINVYSFFEMMAEEVVSDITEAEIIVTNKNVECAEGQTVVREYDIEKMMAYMNM